MALRPTMGRLRPESPRADTWMKVYGDLEVPLVSPVPTTGTFPGVGEKLCFFVDVVKLSPLVFRRLVEHVSKTFEVPEDEVRAEMTESMFGCPILADDVSVSFDARLVMDDDDERYGEKMEAAYFGDTDDDNEVYDKDDD